MFSSNVHHEKYIFGRKKKIERRRKNGKKEGGNWEKEEKKERHEIEIQIEKREVDQARILREDSFNFISFQKSKEFDERVKLWEAEKYV